MTTPKLLTQKPKGNTRLLTAQERNLKLHKEANCLVCKKAILEPDDEKDDLSYLYFVKGNARTGSTDSVVGLPILVMTSLVN